MSDPFSPTERLPAPSSSERPSDAEERPDEIGPEEDDLELDIPWEERCVVCGHWSGATHRFVQDH